MLEQDFYLLSLLRVIVELATHKKIYFASDFHLGAPNYTASRERERLVVQWLDAIKEDAQAIYLVGDVFDFWFDYKTVVPRGYIRLLGKLAELREAGIAIYLFTGNHDLWYNDYFPTELDIPVYKAPIQIDINGKHFFVGHGDGLGPHDTGYKLMKKVFTNPLCKWLFRWLHPDLGVSLASFLSRRSRASQGYEETFVKPEDEWLYLYANRKLKALPHTNYFVFGHRHLPLDLTLDNGTSRYINLGEWFKAKTYAVFDGEELSLKVFEANPEPA